MMMNMYNRNMDKKIIEWRRMRAWELKQEGWCKNGYRSLSGKMYEGTVLGKGEVPLKEIVEFLHANSYDGFLSIE